MFDATDVFAREVLQKSIFALPCCMGSIFCFASHAAWECDFCCLQHLSSEKAIFFHFFNTSPARITKMKKIALRSHVVEASARKVQLQKSAANLRPAPVSTIGTRFSTSQKNLQIDSIMSVIPPEYQWLRLPDAQQISYNFIQFHKKCSQNPKNYNDFNDFKYSVCFSKFDAQSKCKFKCVELGRPDSRMWCP